MDLNNLGASVLLTKQVAQGHPLPLPRLMHRQGLSMQRPPIKAQLKRDDTAIQAGWSAWRRPMQ